MQTSLRRTFRYEWWVVLTAVVALYLINNLVLYRGGFISTHIIIPALWGLMAMAVLRLPRQRASGKKGFREPIIIFAATIALAHIFISFLGGFFYGFGESPYSFTPPKIIQNLVYVATALAGMELSRAWLVNNFSKHNLPLKLGGIAVIYTLISIPLTRITDANVDLETMQWMNSAFIPVLAESLLASYLAYIGGPVPAMAYRGIMQTFLWFCPILPDPEWMVQAITGTVVPMIGLLAIERIYTPHQRKPIKQKKQTGRRWSAFLWVITSITVILIILFSIGFLGFHPTVIISGSMSPAIEIGDIAVVDETPANAIREGDIIEFTAEDGMSIVHRVHSIIINEDGSRLFVTKGDSNDIPDFDPIHPEQIKGKVLYTIPKLGWISIGVKELFLW